MDKSLGRLSTSQKPGWPVKHSTPLNGHSLKPALSPLSGARKAWRTSRLKLQELSGGHRLYMWTRRKLCSFKIVVAEAVAKYKCLLFITYSICTIHTGESRIKAHYFDFRNSRWIYLLPITYPYLSISLKIKFSLLWVPWINVDIYSEQSSSAHYLSRFKEPQSKITLILGCSLNRLFQNCRQHTMFNSL